MDKILVNAVKDYVGGNINEEEFVTRLRRIEAPDSNVKLVIELHTLMQCTIQVVVNKVDDSVERIHAMPYL